MLPTAWFDYELPPELIARYPAEKRDGSRMMVYDRQTGETEIRPFGAILDYLEPGDALICNNTRVRRGRMYGRKNGLPDGAKFEILLLEPFKDEWKVMLKPGKRALPGVRVALLESDGQLNTRGDEFVVVGKNSDNSYQVKFSNPHVEEFEQRYGHIPLPPYINRPDENGDAERYQTVYASRLGAVAAPTAGLHFTPEILAQARAQGVNCGELTLHVGAGTFLPVTETDAEKHHMHFEEYELTPEVAELVNATHRNGHKVVAVGTTSVRTLESCAREDGVVMPQRGRTNIFLYPPYKIRAVDRLLTNFHLPQSTLLMLVSCFSDREKVLAAYQRAIAARMRFYSYGDCMFLK